jgi:hypothetical protein
LQSVGGTKESTKGDSANYEHESHITSSKQRPNWSFRIVLCSSFARHTLDSFRPLLHLPIRCSSNSSASSRSWPDRLWPRRAKGPPSEFRTLLLPSGLRLREIITAQYVPYMRLHFYRSLSTNSSFGMGVCSRSAKPRRTGSAVRTFVTGMVTAVRSPPGGTIASFSTISLTPLVGEVWTSPYLASVTGTSLPSGSIVSRLYSFSSVPSLGAPLEPWTDTVALYSSQDRVLLRDLLSLMSPKKWSWP